MVFYTALRRVIVFYTTLHFVNKGSYACYTALQFVTKDSYGVLHYTTVYN
jgi:hypothetical protein